VIKVNKQLLGGIFLIVIAFLMFIFMPLLLGGIHTVTSDANITDYTGLATVAAAVPTLVLIAGLGMGFWGVFSGIKQRQAAGGDGHKR
jgi:hypothetical protein